jgi:hypothetical protein
MAETISRYQTIKAEIQALVQQAAGPISKQAIRRAVVGRDSWIDDALQELVDEGLATRIGGVFYPADWTPPVDLADKCDRCPAYRRGELCGRSPAECWRAAWAAAGRPSPIPAWEAAGRPSRRAWRASGGLFSFDVINECFWPDSNCGAANGWTSQMCGRASCVDCVEDWPKLGRCSAPTSRGRLCRNAAGTCPAHNGNGGGTT